jgi:hypothetical protein
MSGPGSPTRLLTFEGLPPLRAKTEAVSKLLQDQLTTHLETLRPILSPERLFGKSVGSRTETPLADRALAQIQQSYKPFSARPFDLPAEFDAYWLTLVGSRVTVYPWEYSHEASDGRETRSITMTSPVRWVVSFASAYTLSQFRQALFGKGERRPEHVRQFVVNALVAQLVFTHSSGLAALFTDLRYQVQTQSSPDLPQLPLTTVTAGLPSFRPSDDLILTATNLSGIPAFIELIDIDAVSHLQDPLRARIEERLR